MVQPTNKRFLLESDKAVANGLATLGADSKIPAGQLPDQSGTYLTAAQKGAASGVATLDGTTKIPAAQIPDLSGTYAKKQNLVANVKDYGATGDGTTDDTAAVNSAVAAVIAKGGGTVHFPAGTYSLNTIYITGSNIAITGEGQGATVLLRRAGVGIDCRVLAFNSTGKANTPAQGSYITNLSVSRLTINANNSNVSSNVSSATVQGAICGVNITNSVFSDIYILNPREIGVNLYGCIGVIASNVTIDGMKGDQIVNSFNVQGDNYMDGTGQKYPSSNIRIRGCRVIRNWAAPGDSPAGAGFGVCVIGSTAVDVSDTLIDFSGESPSRGRNGNGIIFEGGGSSAPLLGRRYSATGNNVTYCNYGLGAIDSAASQNTTGLIDGLVIAGNVVTDCSQGIKAVGRNASITGNTVNADAPIVLGIATKPSVEENFTVVGNTLSPQVNRGIYAQKTTAGGSIDGLVIAGNTIDGAAVPTKTGLGVYLQGKIQNFTVSHNVIKNTAAAGIYLNSSAADLQPMNGRIVGNELINVVRVTSDYPQYYGVGSSGCTDVLVAMNQIIAGAAMVKGTGSVNTGKFTVFGNVGAGGVAATDEGNAALRMGGTVTGSRGGNAALASLLTAMASAQLVSDTTTA